MDAAAEAALKWELKCLRNRLMLVERFALRAYVSGPVLADKMTLDQSLSVISKAIEENAKELELMILSDPALSNLTDAQRVLHAEEWREMMDEMKAYVLRFGREVKTNLGNKR